MPPRQRFHGGQRTLHYRMRFLAGLAEGLGPLVGGIFFLCLALVIKTWHRLDVAPLRRLRRERRDALRRQESALMRVLRAIGLSIGIAAAALWLLRGIAVPVTLPYLIWLGLHEGGYPLWAQILGVAAVVFALGYLIY